MGQRKKVTKLEKYFKQYDKYTTWQYLWDVTKVVTIKRCIALNSYIRKQHTTF